MLNVNAAFCWKHMSVNMDGIFWGIRPIFCARNNFQLLFTTVEF